MYELWILCRRSPPQPPDGWPREIDGVSFATMDLPESVWRPFFDDSPELVIYASRDDSGSLDVMTKTARDLADAGDGVVLARVPMVIPLQFREFYSGRGEPPPHI